MSSSNGLAHQRQRGTSLITRRISA